MVGAPASANATVACGHAQCGMSGCSEPLRGGVTVALVPEPVTAFTSLPVPEVVGHPARMILAHGCR